MTADQFEQEAVDAESRAATVRMAMIGRGTAVSARLPHEHATKPSD